MIKQLHKLMLLAVAALFAVDGHAYEDDYEYGVKIDDIYYDLDNVNLTAKVTYEYWGSNDSIHNSYSGSVIIPTTINHNSNTYTVTTVGMCAFANSIGLTSITIPSSVTSIGYAAFRGCKGLTSVTIPSSVTSIDESVFEECLSLASMTVATGNPVYDSREGCNAIIETKTNTLTIGCKGTVIPSSVTSIGKSAFRWCYGLTSITIPSSVTSIGDYAFRGCKGLTSVIIPSSVTEIGNYAFSDCHLKSMYLLTKGRSYEFYRNLIRDARISAIYAYSSELKHFQEMYYDDIFTGTRRDIEEPYHLSKHSYYRGIEFSIIANELMSATLQSIKCRGEELFPDNNGMYRISGLDPKTSYIITVTYRNAEDGAERSYTITLETAKPTIRAKVLKSTLTTVTLKVTASTDTTCLPIEKMGVICNGNDYYCIDDTVVVTGLKPNTYYNNLLTFAEYGTKRITGYEYGHKTTPIAIKLTTLQPKCVSSTCAIVAAETNISEEEPNVGFQWKKYDAPESLKPNEGYAAIHDGQVEGYIKNLQSTFYYNVRAFYKSNDGTYYYGDWVTFDPSDFSFFEPTVQTYGAKNVTENKARLNGYALAGTDEIEEQGFDYWKQGESEENARSIRAEMAPAATEEDVHTVLATGQRMSVELRDLESGTTYCFRAFVKTALGKTYGQEETFKTLGLPTGIDDVMSNETAPEIEGYYDLHGRKLQKPQHGINIIRYTDGTARKVLMK